MGPSIWQLLLVLLIILMFFGAGKLPKVMRELGQGVRSLKEGMKEEDKPDSAEKITSDSQEK